MRQVVLLLLLLLIVVGPTCTLAQAQKAQLTVQLGHSFWVNNVAYSPDGKTLASGSVDGRIKLWDTATGWLLRTLERQGHTDGSLVYSPDGKTLASGSSYGIVEVWDAATGQRLRAFRLRTPPVHTFNFPCLAYSPDGKTLASGSEGNIIKLWDIATGQLRRTFAKRTKEGDHWVTSLAYSPGGKTLASGSQGTVKLWDASTGQLLRALEPEKCEVYSLAYSPNGKTLAVGLEGAVRLWDIATGRMLRVMAGHSAEVTSLAYSPGGKTLASGGGGTIKVWDPATGQLRRTLEREEYHRGGIAYSPDGKTLVSGSGDIVKVWDAATGQPLRAFEGHTSGVPSLAYSPDGKILAVGSGGTTKLRDAATGQLRRTLEGPGNIRYSPDGKTLATGSEGTIKVWDTATGQLLQTLLLEAPDTWLRSLAYSPDGRNLASISGITFRVWDVATGQILLLHTLEGETSDACNITYSPDGKILAVAGSYTIKLWDAATAKVLRTLEAHTFESFDPRVVYSPDGKTLVAASGDSKIKVWDTATGQLLRTLEAPASLFYNLAYSPDGKTLAMETEGTTKLWDAATGQLLRTLVGEASQVSSLAFSPDSKTLAIGSEGTIRVWDTATGQLLLITHIFKGNDSVVLDPQGRFDGTGSGLKELHYVVGLEPVELNQLKERYYQPDLWAKVMGTAADRALRDVPQFNEVALYPEVEVVPPAAGDTHLTIKLHRRSGGYGKVEVHVAGSNVLPDVRSKGFDPAAATQTIQVDLAGAQISPGAEVPVEVVGWNQEGDVRSRAVGLKFRMPGKKAIEQAAKGKFYAIVVGTSRYANTSLNLRFAAKDAADFAHALDLASPPELFASKQIHLLTTDASDAALQPTKSNIAAAFAQVAKDATEKDVVVLYFSGHGVGLVRGNKNFYCYPTRDALSASADTFKDETLLNTTTVNSQDLDAWLSGPNRIKAQKRVLILDTCAAAAYAQNEAPAPLSEQKDISSDIVLALDKLRDNTGYHVLMGCAATAQSYEASRYAQGLLTYSLLRYMKIDGRADGREVDVDKLFRFASQGAHELAERNHLSQQPRILAGEGNSFPIGLLDDAVRPQVPLAGEKPVLLRPVLTNSAMHFDDLDLSGAVQARLQEMCATEARGSQTPVYVNVNWKEYSDGVQPAGDYHIEGDQVQVQLVLVQGGKASAPRPVTGPAAEDKRAQLVQAIVDAILKQ